ncbi:MAG: hypothetical protein V4714_10470 [Bacteroidota bacterium]
MKPNIPDNKEEANEVTVVIEKEETGYKASIEGVSGLSVAGETVPEARKNLWDSIRALKSKLFSGKPFKVKEKIKLFFPSKKVSK